MKHILGKRFAFAYKVKLQSKFEDIDCLSEMVATSTHEEPMASNPEMLFQQLQEGKVTLNLMPMLALMAWNSDVWDGQMGQTVMKNWWQSVLVQAWQGDVLPKKLMVLRAVLADNERYPGPGPVIRAMRQHLRSSLQQQFKRTEEETIILALLEQDAQKLALCAWQCLESVSVVVARQQLPHHLPLVKEAQLHWLRLWLNGSMTERQSTTPALKLLLNQHDLSVQLQCARTILDNDSVYKNIEQHQDVLEDYAEIVGYFSMWNRQAEFRNSLSEKQLQRLGHWLGTGNYQTLKNILYEIVHYEAQYGTTEDDQKKIEVSKNRYLFWQDYQHLFREAWLLVSESVYDGYATCRQADNIKKVLGLTYPKILIRLGNYFVIQTFVQKGIGVDLVMTSDVYAVELCLSKNGLSANDLDDLSLSLIHDHVFLWQEMLESTLSKYFSIYKNKTYKKNHSAQDRKNWETRKGQLKKWEDAARKRYGNDAVNRFALSLVDAVEPFD